MRGDFSKCGRNDRVRERVRVRVWVWVWVLVRVRGRGRGRVWARAVDSRCGDA